MTSPLQPTPCGAGMGEITLMNRVGRVLQDLACDRWVSEADIRQHAADCDALMEAATARFAAFHNPADRDEAVLWMHRLAEAERTLSRAWTTSHGLAVVGAA